MWNCLPPTFKQKTNEKSICAICRGEIVPGYVSHSTTYFHPFSTQFEKKNIVWQDQYQPTIPLNFKRIEKNKVVLTCIRHETWYKLSSQSTKILTTFACKAIVIRLFVQFCRFIGELVIGATSISNCIRENGDGSNLHPTRFRMEKEPLNKQYSQWHDTRYKTVE